MKLFSINKVIDEKKEVLYYFLLTGVLLMIFLLVGDRGYVLFKDSQAYLAFRNRSGVMPVYPLFLFLNRLLFGEAHYLYAVVIQQTIWAVLCIMLFFHFIRRRFSLGKIQSVPIIIALFIPFSVDLPASLTNHAILTEAIAYPLFYIYMIFFLKTIFDKKWRPFIALFACSVGMALIRTQMQLIFIITSAAFFYCVWRKKDGCKTGRRIVSALPYVLVCGGIVVAGLLVTMIFNLAGQKTVVLFNEKMTVSSVQEEKLIDADPDKNRVEVNNMTSQYMHILIDKALYEMDYDDYMLFQDKEVQKLYLAIFARKEENKKRYIYARNDLWKWEDIMNGVADGTSAADNGWNDYISENPDSELDYNEAVSTISFGLLRRHWPRALYHILCLLPSGFICTVFFQKANIYTLCHAVTFLAYASGIGMVIWAFRRKDISENYAENLLGCIVLNVIMVLIMSIMFFAMQRYLIYGFGTFWTAYYILFLKLLEIYLPGKGEKRLNR